MRRFEERFEGEILSRARTNEVLASRNSRKKSNRTEFAMILFANVTARERSQKLQANLCGKCRTANSYRRVTTLLRKMLS